MLFLKKLLNFIVYLLLLTYFIFYLKLFYIKKNVFYLKIKIDNGFHLTNCFDFENKELYSG